MPPPDPARRSAYPPPSAYPAPPGFPQPSFAPAPGYIEPPRRNLAPDPTVIFDRGTSVAAPPEEAAPSLAKSSQIMAIGTLASRVTGFLRTLVLAAALGTHGLADAYNNSNNLPNTIYYLMLGGIFTSVVVPLLVRAAKNDPDRGEGYAERIFSLGVVSLLLVTVVATAMAGPIVTLYASTVHGAERSLMVTWAYFFIPQIFFYGMDSLLGAILNVKGRFGPNMWTPVINNVVVIVVGGMYMVIFGLNKTPNNISPTAVHLLGLGTTAGILLQSIALFPIMRRAGFSMRLRLDFHGAEVREITRMAGWMLGYVVSQWAASVVVQNVANAASRAARGMAIRLTRTAGRCSSSRTRSLESR